MSAVSVFRVADSIQMKINKLSHVNMIRGVTAMVVLAVLGTALPAYSKSVSHDFDFLLPAPVSEDAASYLGLPRDSSFSLGQIDSKIVLVEIFSMYCPICQREAKKVNRLFELIKADKKWHQTIKMIGIGAGNSAFEADFFKTNYKIEFPLFSDSHFKIHKKLGEVGTPHFFGLKVLPGNKVKLFFSHSGEIPDLEKFFQQLKDKSSLELKNEK